MSQDQHVIEGLMLALDAFKDALDDPKLATLRPYAESITSSDLDTFFRQRDDNANPSLNLTAKLSPIKTVLDLTYKAACETYDFEEATVQQLYGCLQCALLAGHNIYQDMSRIVELLDQTGWFLRSTVMGQGQVQISRQLWGCVCLISEHITRLCTVYISQGLSPAEKLAHSITWNLIRDAHNEYKTKQSQDLLKSHESQERFHKIEAGQRYTEIRALAQQFDTTTDVFECDDCDRYFLSQNALNQHLNSPAHKFECDDCDRSFGSQHALNQHLDSPAHVFECDDCDRCFRSQHALDQHFSSPIHAYW